MSYITGIIDTLLSAVTATGASRSTRVDQHKASLVVTGITTATVHLEGSADNTNWVSLGSVTADGVVTKDNAVPYLRANVTAYTSGTISAKLCY